MADKPEPVTSIADIKAMEDGKIFKFGGLVSGGFYSSLPQLLEILLVDSGGDTINGTISEDYKDGLKQDRPLSGNAVYHIYPSERIRELSSGWISINSIDN